MGRSRWMVTPVGPLPVLRPPATHSDFESIIGAVPAVGEHTDSILKELGYTSAQADALRAAKAV